MVYNFVSSKQIIGRIARNTGKNLPSEYIDDLLEWIPEAIEKLHTKYTLVEDFKTLEISNHSAPLPCHLMVLNAVEYKGRRLREGGDIRNLKAPLPFSSRRGGEADLWETETTNKDYSEDGINRQYIEELRGQDLVKSNVADYTAEYYKLQGNCIQTSFECGEITIHYSRLPLDREGYPLIPDNDNYKEALYWYCLMKMIEAGYEHKIFDWKHCWQMFESVYARRAINEIKYPSVDRMERIYRASARLVPPEHFYEDFRINSEQIQDIRK